jgi:bifunctional UDP-N-acetylglucosamine pyrophosphorylase/glucosamine-1-phosphate N-acetyltransferase
MQQGTTIIDPARVDIRGEVQVGSDVTIDVGVVLEGSVTLGDGCVIGPHVVLRDVSLGKNVNIRAHSVVEGAKMQDGCEIGPFARIRPYTQLGSQCKIGNFVEIKNTDMDAEVKVNHLSYIGDATVGDQTNIGAGVITANYDGVSKHRTVLEADVQVGSNSVLVAPVRLEKGATIGAGTVLTRDAPGGRLTLARAEQKTVESWRRKKGEEKG